LNIHFIRHILRLDYSFIFLFLQAMKFQDLHHDEAVLQELGVSGMGKL
jgi:hypothetical protein